MRSVQSMSVFALPPNESLSSIVSFEFRYGMWGALKTAAVVDAAATDDDDDDDDDDDSPPPPPPPLLDDDTLCC